MILNYKHYRSKNKILIFSLLSIYLFITAFSLSYIINKFDNTTPNKDFHKTEANNLKSSGYWVLEPFLINDDGLGNYTWQEAALEPWCSGNGTLDNPYVIKNVLINARNAGSCILIYNSTNVYFEINNCTLYNSGPNIYDAGIKLEYTSNATLINNNCSSNKHSGIGFWMSDNNNISSNIVNNNGVVGIGLWSSSYNNISENTAYYNTWEGTGLWNGHDNSFFNNTLNNNAYGVYLGTYYGTTYANTISGNIVKYNTYHGICLWDNYYNIVSQNIAHNNSGSGIYCGYSYYNTISGNLANNNTSNGIYLYNSDWNKILENDVNTDFIGVSVGTNSDFNIILGNTATHNRQDGIGSFFNNNNNIFGNIANINNDHGIYVKGCNDTLIYNNSMMGNGLNNANDDDGINNQWDNGTIGNYWADYGSIDANDDGIGDDPYIIPGTSGSMDNYPIWEDGDDLIPQITINSPIANQFFGSIAPTFNITIVENFLDTVWYTIDEGLTNYTCYGLSETINQSEWDKKESGPVSIYFYAKDTTGNVGHAELMIFKDIGAPSSSIFFIPYEGDNIVNKSTIFTLNADDGMGSGVSVIMYKINDSDWNYYEGSFNLSSYEYGDYLISYQAIDEMGNIEEIKTIIVKLVKIPPPKYIPVVFIVTGVSLGIGIIGIAFIILYKRRR